MSNSFHSYNKCQVWPCCLSATMIKKFTSHFLSDFKSVFVWHLTGKILSFEFYPKVAFFECKFRISWSVIVHVQNWLIGLQRVASRIRWHQRLTTLPPFSLIHDFVKQNTRGNGSKISIILASYWQIRSKSTNHGH